MRRNPVRALATAVVAGSLVLLSACSGGSSTTGSSASALPSLDPNQQTTISFMEAMSSGAQQAALKKMTSDFEAQHPNVKVDLQEQPNYGALQTKITAQVAAQSAPTIAQVYPNWADELSTSGVLVPLDSYVASSDQYKSFYTGIQNDMKLRDGKNWMWPFNKSVVVQYYNESKVPNAPTTWDQFSQDAKSVSNNGVVALSIDPGSETSPAGGTALFEILAEANGTPVFAEDGTPQFDSDAAKKAMNYLVDLKKSNALALGSNYPGQTALGNQTGAFDVSSVASYPFNQNAVGGKFTMGVAPLPAGPSKTANQLAGTNIAMFASASDQQRAAAWAYMQFLTSPAEMAYWATQTGYLPVTKDAMNEQVMKDYVAKEQWLTSVVEQLDTATPLPAVSYVNKASGALSTAITSAVNGTASVDDALATAQAAAKKAASEQ
ncbi:extracellular solute-binding protein [Propionibacterium sp.]|uniref:extracellular solute-binding protein n=1 Tax=Propionibacterium sp. TaxID=1977903 RepID=UPI0039E72F94